jgi:RNA polymerase sigma-70 factor (ECF subfamily)
MSFRREVPREETFSGFVTLRETFGFVPKLFQAQTLLPRLIEAEAQILSAVFQQGALSRVQKECIFLVVAVAHQNSYCATLHYEGLRSLGESEPQIDVVLNDHRSLPRHEAALLDFSLRLIHHPTRLNVKDIDELRTVGFGDPAVLEAALAVALARMLCTISAGVAPESDFEPRELPAAIVCRMRDAGSGSENLQVGLHPARPYLYSPELSADSFEPFAFFESRLGVVPNLFRAQTLRPDVIEAEARAAGLIVANEDVLPQVKKEIILLVIAAANLNTYCVAAHCAMLRHLGLSSEESDQIAIDHHQADLCQADQALLDFTLKVGLRPAEVQGNDIAHLREHGFSEEQILESVVTTAFGNFLNTLGVGLGAVPDFEPRRVFEPKDMKRPSTAWSITQGVVAAEDPDASLVVRVQNGDVEAFAELIRRHEHRVYRTILGILGDPVEAQDGLQNAFLKAFKHINEFQGRSKFATWLISITRNTALQLLRDQDETESLDVGSQEEEGFRPLQVRAWQENPEELYSQAEMRDLVEQEIMRLPPKYRIVVMLHDIEQLSKDEVAVALDLSVTAVKARLYRARLALRDSLAPFFTVGARRTSP